MGAAAQLTGLSLAQVDQRHRDGRANVVSRRSSRGTWSIVRANVLTRFNAIIGTLLIVVLVFGPPQDALFGLVIGVNSAVGIVQELRAKRVLDALALIERAPVRVRRDGVAASVPPEDVVVDDVVLLGPGMRLVVDGDVTAVDGLEIDESLLTGEAEPVAKGVGDAVLSGSFVVAGSGAYVATRVGSDAYANRLVAQVSRFDLAHSTLMAGINRLLRIITWIVVPVGALLVASQMLATHRLAEAMVGSVAGVVPLIPEGLVLMTSVAFAVGAIRLGRRRCLVQELPAIEVLARVDVLCLDKTGTLTAPGMDLATVDVVAADDAEARAALGALAHADQSPNPTMAAVARGVPAPLDGWPVVTAVPFSSARRYSAATFAGHGSWVLGAPDAILEPHDPVRARAESLAAQGLRVLALGRVPEGSVTSAGRLSTVRAAALVVLRQRLRPEAAGALTQLSGQGIEVKVLSGDNAAAVGAVAADAGVAGAASPVDATTLGDDPTRLAEQVARHSVFGRVDPQRKRDIIAALHRRGHTVAMTGDGVNDALALKDADLGIAMGSGAAATRAVAKLVLLDDSFATLPHILAEGRRVLGNIERVAHLFLIKTGYALVLALLVGVTRLPFPLLPRHVTLIGTLTIGIPGFFLALAPNSERARPGFLGRVLRLAVPAGVVCGLTTFAAYGFARLADPGGQAADRSASALTLFIVAAWALALIARPYTPWRVALVAAMVSAFVVVAMVPFTADFFALTFTDPVDGIVAMTAGAAGVIALTGVHRLGAARPPGMDPPSRGVQDAPGPDGPTSRPPAGVSWN